MIEVEAEDDAWARAVPDWEALSTRAAELALKSFPVGEGGPGVAQRSLVDEAFPEAPGGSSKAPSVLTLRAEPPPPMGKDFDGDVTILLTDDEIVRDLNDRFRNQNKATNVLSFPAHETATGHLGDIALAYGVCAREADEQAKPLAHHLQHLVAHGVLHLLGYDHEDEADAQVMEDLERQILARLGLPDPYA
jgi:probable rRNA maturation factor